ncbi:MAG TPA: hypothetical protein VEY93_13685 [Longimicrobium sp.]|nr:hypothetical protein [Longimicrobium sp.]
MSKPKPISDPVVRVLSWLLGLAVQRAGYTVRGVPGWATAEQIETGMKTWGTAEVMRAEAKRGRVLQHDARPPGDSRPSWLYRVSQAGVDQLAAARDTVPPRISPPLDQDESRVLVRETAWHAIEGLRSALDPEVRPRRIWVEGEVGWRSSRELTSAMAKEDDAAGRPYRWFTTDDLRWLVRVGYAEKRLIQGAHVYRLTPVGTAIQVLDRTEVVRND